MGSIVIVIVFVVFSVLATMAKQKQQQDARKRIQDEIEAKKASQNYRTSSESYTSSSIYNSSNRGRNQSMKSRANTSVNTNTSTSASSYATNKAAERARDNMTEQELRFRPTAKEFRQMAGVEASDGAILSAAKMHNLATELSNEFDSREDLMKPVYDLMVTGPDTSLPNTRDFVSEGMDMINSYTMTGENISVG